MRLFCHIMEYGLFLVLSFLSCFFCCRLFCRKSCLDAQADPSLVRIDLHDLDVNSLTNLEFVEYVLDSLVSDLGYVYESIETCLEFYECAVILDLYDFTLEYIAYLILLAYECPWLRLSLLEAQADLALLLVEGEDLNIDDVTDLENFFRVFELAPGDLRDVEKSIDSADIYECAVVSESHNLTLDDVADVQVLPDLSYSLALLINQYGFS